MNNMKSLLLCGAVALMAAGSATSASAAGLGLANPLSSLATALKPLNAPVNAALGNISNAPSSTLAKVNPLFAPLNTALHPITAPINAQLQSGVGSAQASLSGVTSGNLPPVSVSAVVGTLQGSLSAVLSGGLPAVTASLTGGH
jgi:hypothetical protein